MILATPGNPMPGVVCLWDRGQSILERKRGLEVPVCLDSLVAAFKKRSKAIRYSCQMQVTRGRITGSRAYVVIDIRRSGGMTIQFTFEAAGFVSIAIEHRPNKKPVRRLAKLHPLHIDEGPDQLVARCETTIWIGGVEMDDDWWRTAGQHKLESLWLHIGT
jgi:hypothetical protein